MKELSFSQDTVRVFLHLLGVAVWVGGQIVIGFMVPLMKKFIGIPDAAQRMAQRFNKIAWPFFILVIFTGIWGLGENFDDYTTSGKIGLMIKLIFVFLSGVSAWVHTKETSGSMKRITAMGTLLFALVAMFFGLSLSIP